MTLTNDKPLQACAHADEEYCLNCAEALVAGTLALMTAHAQACCDQQRLRMAAKVAENLQALARDGAMSAGFRSFALSLHQRWQGGESVADLPPRTLWHRSPEVLQ